MVEFSSIEPLQVQLITTKDQKVFRRFRSDIWEVKRDNKWEIAYESDDL